MSAEELEAYYLEMGEAYEEILFEADHDGSIEPYDRLTKDPGKGLMWEIPD